MKLYNFAMALDDPNQEIQVIDRKTGRMRWSGPAEYLLDYVGCEYCTVKGIIVSDGVLNVYVWAHY